MDDSSKLTRGHPLPGENYAMMNSRLALALNIQDVAWRKMLSPEELEQPYGVVREVYTPGRDALEQIYADTVAAYRPILAEFLRSIMAEANESDEVPASYAPAIIAALPRLVAALPDELCATAVAAAWNTAPLEIASPGIDDRCRVWLYAFPGLMTGGKIYAVDEKNEPHPLAVDRKPAPA